MNSIKISKSLFSLSLYLLSVVTFSTLLLVQAAHSSAEEQVCKREPSTQKGVDTIHSSSSIVQGYVLQIQLRYERSTGSKWVRACIPSGTKLYLKDKDGHEYGAYTTQVHGWNYADKFRTKKPLKACAKHPSDSREFCTPFG